MSARTLASLSPTWSTRSVTRSTSSAGTTNARCHWPTHDPRAHRGAAQFDRLQPHRSSSPATGVSASFGPIARSRELSAPISSVEIPTTSRALPSGRIAKRTPNTRVRYSSVVRSAAAPARNKCRLRPSSVRHCPSAHCTRLRIHQRDTPRACRAATTHSSNERASGLPMHLRVAQGPCCLAFDDRLAVRDAMSAAGSAIGRRDSCQFGARCWACGAARGGSRWAATCGGLSRLPR